MLFLGQPTGPDDLKCPWAEEERDKALWPTDSPRVQAKSAPKWGMAWPCKARPRKSGSGLATERAGGRPGRRTLGCSFLGTT